MDELTVHTELLTKEELMKRYPMTLDEAVKMEKDLNTQRELQDQKIELLTFLYQDGHRYVCTKSMFETLLKNDLYFKDVTRPPDMKRGFRGDAFGDPDVKKLRY